MHCPEGAAGKVKVALSEIKELVMSLVVEVALWVHLPGYSAVYDFVSTETIFLSACRKFDCEGYHIANPLSHQAQPSKSS